jgi:carbon monoxide dehydrogenase subunit G
MGSLLFAMVGCLRFRPFETPPHMRRNLRNQAARSTDTYQAAYSVRKGKRSDRTMWFELRREDLAFLDTATVVHACVADVAAPRALVFAALADPRTWREWFPGVREASYPSPPPHGVGSIRVAQVDATRWIEEIIAWEHDRRWAYTVTRTSVPFARAQVESFDVSDGAAGTRVCWTLALEPRLLARLGAPLAPGILDRLFRRAMRNLEGFLQRDTPGHG